MTDLRIKRIAQATRKAYLEDQPISYSEIAAIGGFSSARDPAVSAALTKIMHTTVL